MEMRVLHLGNDEPNCIHCELAKLILLYLSGRLACGELTSAVDLRDSLVLLACEVDAQLVSPPDIIGTPQGSA